ncbi:MAG: hypothetical protein IPK74_36465 [Deltaproteobacteria bacterium]|nr:hypothetical protein [Deltaproteobacteria bacterium]
MYYGTEQGFDGGNDPANRERLWDTGFDITNPTFTGATSGAAPRAPQVAASRWHAGVWSTTAVGDEPDAGIFAFERLGGDGGGSYAVVVFNSHHGQASTTRTPDRAMTVAAPAGTELVDACWPRTANASWSPATAASTSRSRRCRR